MTKKDFRDHLASLYARYPLIDKNKRKSINELLYVLRMDSDYNYNITICEGNKYKFIPDVRETFVPLRTLTKYVGLVTLDEDMCYGNCLTLTVDIHRYKKFEKMEV